MTPSQWFDQFGDAGTGITDDDPQWCWRHWAPAEILGWYHLGLMLEMTQRFAEQVRAGDSSPDLAARVTQAGRICCQFGDEVMFELWQHWQTAPP